MIKRVKIQNCLSFVDAEVELSPFTLLVGANGVGKSNFFSVLSSVTDGKGTLPAKHQNHPDLAQFVELRDEGGHELRSSGGGGTTGDWFHGIIGEVGLFRLEPKYAGREEALTSKPAVDLDGRGVVRVLDALKTGDREELFNEVQRLLTSYIPEVERLSFAPFEGGKKLQVREKHIDSPVPVSQLSDGTKLIILILTILHQEHRPEVICIEDIDHGLHPRLLQGVFDLCFDLTSEEGGPQIIATTQNPYAVDLFKDHEEAVILVEKKGGGTTLTTLADRLEEKGIEDPDPLGELWFSGAVGAVPQVGR